MAEYLAKLRSTFRFFKDNGGLLKSLGAAYRRDTLKVGRLVGVDKFGNKYYQNKMYFIARSRWVNYADHYGMDFNASQVPAEWHRWLQYITDEPPTEKPLTHYKWMLDHEENLTGTNHCYVPHSTTRPKLESWVPPGRPDNA